MDTEQTIAKSPAQKSRSHATRQLQIIHLSDIHFGKYHRFDPPPTPKGDTPPRTGYPTLIEKLQEDFQGDDPGCPVMVCITGDLATEASFGEFQEAEEFIHDFSESQIYGKARGLRTFFMVPGNHDVQYDSNDIGQRWERWVGLWNEVYGTSVKKKDPWGLVSLYDRIDELGALILCLNSAIYVQKGKPDEDRGQVDLKQLQIVKDRLDEIPDDKLQSAIRVALIHHHPVLIPALAEPGRGYDAVHNSGKLLTILRQYGFHLVLHGHKHIPFNFTDDTQSPFWKRPAKPILIAGGGSVGSSALPDLPGRCNCFNRISIKWNPEAGQTRIAIETRGLCVFTRDGIEDIPSRWKWETLRFDDRNFQRGERLPRPRKLDYCKFDLSVLGEAEAVRKAEYARTRGNLPVVEVLPSLIPRQGYEARVWIVGHNRRDEDIPTEVTWAAGEKFPTATIKDAEDPNFCGTFSYWGPMMIQGKLSFRDGRFELVHVYARLPRDYSAET